MKIFLFAILLCQWLALANCQSDSELKLYVEQSLPYMEIALNSILLRLVRIGRRHHRIRGSRVLLRFPVFLEDEEGVFKCRATFIMDDATKKFNLKCKGKEVNKNLL